MFVSTPTSLVYAGNLVMITASSQADSATGSIQYSPMNVLDSRLDRVWCSDLHDEQPWLRFVFKRRQVIDRVVIHTANQLGNRIDVVHFGTEQHLIEMHAKSDNIDEKLLKPMDSRVFVISIAQLTTVLNSNALVGSACLTGVSLYHGGRIVSAIFDKDQSIAGIEKIVGTWHAGPLGATENSLTFNLDGTYAWQHHALLTGNNKEEYGIYQFVGNHLVMQRLDIKDASKFDMQIMFQRVHIDNADIGAPRADYDTMVLKTQHLLGKDIKGTYNNAEF